MALIHEFQTPRAHYAYDSLTHAITDVTVENHESQTTGIDTGARPGETIGSVEARVDCAGLPRTRAHRMGQDEQTKACGMEKIVHPVTRFYGQMLRTHMGHLTLQVTQRCNLRCRYCGFSDGDNDMRNHARKDMPWSIAQKAIDLYARSCGQAPIAHLGFYGGEPLLRLEFIQKCTQYFDDRLAGKVRTYGLTTNGTLLTPAVTAYLSSMQFAVLVSLDGPREVHDANRCFPSGQGSFDLVTQNLREMAETHPQYCRDHVSFNAVLDPEGDFCSTNSYFAFDKEMSRFGSVRFSEMQRHDGSTHSEQLSRDTVLAFYDDLEYEELKYLAHKIGYLPTCETPSAIREVVDTGLNELRRVFHSQSTPPRFGHPSGPCVPGVRRLFVTCDGVLLPCERVNEESPVCIIGDVDRGVIPEQGMAVLNVCENADEYCKRCWAWRLCGVCVGQIDTGKEKEITAERLLSSCSERRARADRKLREYAMLRELRILR